MHTASKIIHASMMTRFLFYAIIDLATAFVAGVLLAYLPQFNPFLIFIPTITFFAWIGGFMTGFTTTVVSFFFITIMLFFPINHPLLPANNNLIFETAIFFFVAIFISYVIDTAKQQDKISDYQRKLRQTHQVIETLEKSYESSQKEIKARDQFLAIASHELKTPVTSMLLQVQTAIHNIRNVSLANFSVVTLLKMLEDTEQQSKRLSKMVNDLLDLSLITTGKMDLEIEKVDISRTTQDVVERFANRLVDKNQLRIITKKVVIGYCDKLRIEQAITNLISNAIKYGNNKLIEIEVNDGHEMARIIVKDQGIGIPHDQQKKIFNRFERAVSARDYKGLGVGLYITCQIVKAHNGKIHLESHPDKGSIFTLEFPLQAKK